MTETPTMEFSRPIDDIILYWAKMRQKNTTMRVIETLMPSAPKKEPSEIAPAKFEVVKSSPGKKCGVNCCSTALEMNAEFTIQYTGKAQMIARTMARAVSRTRPSLTVIVP